MSRNLSIILICSRITRIFSVFFHNFLGVELLMKDNLRFTMGGQLSILAVSEVLPLYRDDLGWPELWNWHVDSFGTVVNSYNL